MKSHPPSSSDPLPPEFSTPDNTVIYEAEVGGAQTDIHALKIQIPPHPVRDLLKHKVGAVALTPTREAGSRRGL